jgi:hypothetical protein
VKEEYTMSLNKDGLSPNKGEVHPREMETLEFFVSKNSLVSSVLKHL